jgi:hypothetical protein
LRVPQTSLSGIQKRSSLAVLTLLSTLLSTTGACLPYSGDSPVCSSASDRSAAAPAAPITAQLLPNVSALIAQFPPQVRCSGVWLNEHVVLTTAHCDADELSVGIGTDAAHAQWGRVVGKFLHPSMDVMLLQTEPSLSDHLATAYLTVEPDSVDTPVVIAGFGRRTDGAGGQLKLMQAVVATDLQITTNGPDKPCAGDSGAGLFEMGQDQTLQLVGILKGGSILCDGKDVAERVVAFSDWLMARIDELGC